MADPFESYAGGLESPATRHYVIVPDNAADLPDIPRAIYCNGAGNAVISDGTNDVTYALVAGQVLDFRGRRVKATGTTATLVAWL